jgi:hypothetical protein
MINKVKFDGVPDGSNDLEIPSYENIIGFYS